MPSEKSQSRIILYLTCSIRTLKLQRWRSEKWLVIGDKDSGGRMWGAADSKRKHREQFCSDSAVLNLDCGGGHVTA